MKDGKKVILIADDEAEIRDILKILLTGDGYHVLAAEDGQAAASMMSPEVDLCILDMNMTRLNGFMTAVEIRKNYDTPIVFLTAYSAESDKVMGFSAGADDYVVKPFSNVELLMRVRAILRRHAPAAAPVQQASGRVRIHDIELDTDRQCAVRDGADIPLTYTEYRILELLSTHRKKIFSLDNIYSSIWEEDAVGDSAIMVHIKNIRKKLGDDSRNPTYIKTAWGRGYYID